MPVTGPQAVDHYRERQHQTIEALNRYKQLQRKIQKAGLAAQEQLDRACKDLAAAYQPGLDAANLARVESLTGYLGFKRRDPLKAMAHEKHVLESSIAQIEKDERYVMREELAGPDGTLNAKLAEAKEMVQPFETECDKFEQLEGFTELLQIGYDTPDFAERFWQADYWRHWADGDRICKELGMDDFGDDVLPAYNAVAKQRNFWRDEMQRYGQELAGIHELVRKHDAAQQRIPTLPAVYLSGCQEQLAKHLEQADIGLLDEWRQKSAADDRGIEMALRKVSGLRAKFNMLRAMHDDAVSTMVNDLSERSNKYGKKVIKYGRSKYWYAQIPDRELDHKLPTKLPKYHERAQKMDKLVDRMTAYDDYRRFSLQNDQSLWWYEFTGSRPPRQMGRLRSYYDRHPELRPLHDDLWDDDDNATAVAVAAVETAEPRRDVGYIS